MDIPALLKTQPERTVELLALRYSGADLFSAIFRYLEAGKYRIRLSFEGMDGDVQEFLIFAIRPLYSKFPAAYIKDRLLPPIHVTPKQLELIQETARVGKEMWKGRDFWNLQHSRKLVALGNSKEGKLSARNGLTSEDFEEMGNGIDKRKPESVRTHRKGERRCK